VHAVEKYRESGHLPVPGGRTASGPELDGDRGSSAKRKERKSRGASRVSGQRSKSGKQLCTRADAA
jgi:hypothetical protein